MRVAFDLGFDSEISFELRFNPDRIRSIRHNSFLTRWTFFFLQKSVYIVSASRQMYIIMIIITIIIIATVVVVAVGGAAVLARGSQVNI